MNYLKQTYKTLLISFLLIGALGRSEHVRAEGQFETLTIQTAGGKQIDYQIEIADTDETRRRGLMYRKEMPSNQGMLLDFVAPQKVSIWMKNTYIPLDIIYVDAAGTITQIVPDAVPHSTALMTSDNMVRAVLEVNAGQSAYHGISVGDHAIYRAFKED